MNKPLIRIEDVNVLRETDLAILCQIGGREIWIPKSQVHDDSEIWEEGHSGDLVISEWFARREGIV